MYKKHWYFLLTIFLLICSFSFGETVSQCNELFTAFSEDGYSPTKQALDNTESFDFPYNIILDSQSETSLKPRIFITIEDALHIIPELEKISDYATVVCTANDYSLLNPDFPAGTQTAIDFFSQEKIKTPIIILRLNSNDDIYWNFNPGSDGYITPSYCFKKLKNALESENINSFIADGSLALYKLNLTQSNPSLTFVLENEYPGIQLNFPLNEKNKLVPIVRNFTHGYDYHDPKNKEVNYSSVTIFSKNFTISESSLSFIFVCIVCFSLFSICVLSFMFGRKKIVHKKTLVKYWFIAPLFLIITLICLFLGQLITKWLFPMWETFPHYGVIIKLGFAIFFYSLFYILRKKLRIPSRIFIYSYLLNIVSLVNFFVFSALDLPLLLIFGLEFILIYVSQGFKKPILLIISILLLFLPFIPSIFGIFSNSDFQAIQIFVNSNVLVNILLSLLILPFAFMIMRIIISFNLKHHSNKKLIIKIIINLGLIIIFSIFTIIFNNSLEKNFGQKNTEIQFEITDKELISYSITTKEDIGFSDNDLTIYALANNIYYDINIYSDFPFPIYSANYPFDFFETTDAVHFNLAENPPEKVFLEFLSETSANYTIEIKVYALEDNYLPKSNENIKLYTKVYSIGKPGENKL